MNMVSTSLVQISLVRVCSLLRRKLMALSLTASSPCRICENSPFRHPVEKKAYIDNFYALRMILMTNIRLKQVFPYALPFALVWKRVIRADCTMLTSMVSSVCNNCVSTSAMRGKCWGLPLHNVGKSLIAWRRICKINQQHMEYIVWSKWQMAKLKILQCLANFVTYIKVLIFT